MAQLKRLSDNHVFTTSADPVWRAGIWWCGDQNFQDLAEDEYEVEALNPVICEGFPNPLVPVFLQLFTSTERQAIRAKVANTGAPDPILNDWWAILQDPRTTAVALPGPDQPGLGAQQAIGYLASAGFIASGRVAEILAGHMQ